MEHVKKYGKRPYQVALIHGGPGAAGEMAPVAEELASFCGTLEPYQTEKSIDAQLQELKSVLEKEAELPVILVGFSWGACLSFLLAAKYPQLVKKLILIGSGPFEEKYTKNMMETRLKRLNENERIMIDRLLVSLKDPMTKDKDGILEEMGRLFSKADSYASISEHPKTLVVRYSIYEPVSEQAKQLRASGKLLEFGKKIKCPVVAIHGDYDPHKPEGVQEPLSRTLEQFRFILLKECGHCPWIEQNARERFYTILREEIRI